MFKGIYLFVKHVLIVKIDNISKVVSRHGKKKFIFSGYEEIVESAGKFPWIYYKSNLSQKARKPSK